MRVGWAIKKNRSRANRLKKQPAKYEFRTQKIKNKKRELGSQSLKTIGSSRFLGSSKKDGKKKLRV
jgi:hypothetical protein